MSPSVSAATLQELQHRAEIAGLSVEELLDAVLTPSRVVKSSLLSQVVEKNLWPSILIDPQATQLSITHLNAAFCELTGFDREEVIGRSWLEILGLLPDLTIERLAKTAVNSGQSCAAELQCFRKNGEAFFANAQFVPVYDPGTEKAYLVLSFQDITIQKNREWALRKSRERLNGILNSQIDLVCRYSPDTTLTYVNDAYCAFFEKDRRELVGYSFLCLTPETQHQTIYDRIQEIREDPSPNVRVIPGKTPEGDSIWVQWVDFGIVDDSGQVVEIQAIGRDITIQMVAQEQLRISEEKFRSLFEMAAEGIILIDRNGLITLANRYTEKLFQLSQDELIGQSINHLIPLEVQWEKLIQPVATQQSNREAAMSFVNTFNASLLDGSIVPLEVTLYPVQIQGHEQILCFLADLTDRHRLEAQQSYAFHLENELARERELAELKHRFLAMVSHEFRTPLSVIQASVEILDRYNQRLTAEHQRKKFQNIYDQVSYMVQLIDDMLTFNRGELSQEGLKGQALDLTQFCHEIVEKFRLVDGAAHEIIFDQENLPSTFQMDPFALDHILTNLLSNAVKYSPEGSTVRLKVGSKGTGIEFSIHDQGIGIPEVDMDRIFDPFHRATNAGVGQGTGLGLAIVKQYVESWGGTISFRSRVNSETTFIVWLPPLKISAS